MGRLKRPPDSPCIRCGGIDRYADGSCRPCVLRRSKERYRKDEASRLCSRCKKKPRVDGKMCAWCIENIANGGEPATANRRRYMKDHKLRSTYGISIQEYEEMASSQGGLCLICRDETRSTQRRFGLVVDHDHDTGKVRALLCHRCNSVLGLLEENPEWMIRCAEYIEMFREEGL